VETLLLYINATINIINFTSGARLPTLQLTTSHSQRLNNGKSLGMALAAVMPVSEIEIEIGLNFDQSKQSSLNLRFSFF